MSRQILSGWPQPVIKQVTTPQWAAKGIPVASSVALLFKARTAIAC